MFSTPYFLKKNIFFLDKNILTILHNDKNINDIQNSHINVWSVFPFPSCVLAFSINISIWSLHSGVMILGMRESMLSDKSLEVPSQDHHCGEGLHVATDCEQVPMAFRETYRMLQ